METAERCLYEEHIPGGRTHERRTPHTRPISNDLNQRRVQISEERDIRCRWPLDNSSQPEEEATNRSR